MRKPIFWVCDHIGSKQAAQLQRLARILEFLVLHVESLYFPENLKKGADQTAQAVQHLFCLHATKSGLCPFHY